MKKVVFAFFLLMILAAFVCRQSADDVLSASRLTKVQGSSVEGTTFDNSKGQNIKSNDEPRDVDLSLLETIKLEANRSEIFPLFAIYDKSRWCGRYDLTFERYLPYYRFKRKVGISTPDEIDECIDCMDTLNNKEKAFVLAAIYVYEREKRVRSNETLRYLEKQREPIEEYIKNRELQGLYVPAYVKSPYFYGRAIDVILPYEPKSDIMPETWKKWTRVYKEYVQKSDIAFDIFCPDEINNLSLEMIMRLDGINRGNMYMYRTPDKDKETRGLMAEWIKDVKICENLVKINLGFDVTTNFFKYSFFADGATFWESEFSHHYVYCYPGAPRVSPEGFYRELETEPPFIENFLSGIERLEQESASEKSIMQALRDYWFVTQTFSSDTMFLWETSCHPLYGNSSNAPIYPATFSRITSFILYNRLHYEDDDYQCNGYSVTIDGEKVRLDWSSLWL